MKKPKYIHVEFDGWYTLAGEIQDDKALKLWLSDGSLKEGDIVYETKKKFVVAKNREKLLLREEKDV